MFLLDFIFQLCLNMDIIATDQENKEKYSQMITQHDWCKNKRRRRQRISDTQI